MKICGNNLISPRCPGKLVILKMRHPSLNTRGPVSQKPQLLEGLFSTDISVSVLRALQWAPQPLW